MSDVMKMWRWMMLMVVIIFVCFLYARDTGLRYKGLIDDFAICLESHNADYETCSSIMLDDVDNVDWLDNIVKGD